MPPQHARHENSRKFTSLRACADMHQSFQHEIIWSLCFVTIYTVSIYDSSRHRSQMAGPHSEFQSLEASCLRIVPSIVLTLTHPMCFHFNKRTNQQCMSKVTASIFKIFQVCCRDSNSPDRKSSIQIRSSGKHYIIYFSSQPQSLDQAQNRRRSGSFVFNSRSRTINLRP